jgi:hypothetical protein
MPRPLKIKSVETGKSYTVQWDKARNPTDSEIDRLIAEQETAPAGPIGPVASPTKPSFEDLTSTITRPRLDLSAPAPMRQSQNAGAASPPGLWTKTVDTLYGGQQSALPAIPGITRRLLSEYEGQMPGLPGMGPTDPRIAKWGYNNLVVPSSSAVGLATDWATGKVAGPIIKAASPYVQRAAAPAIEAATPYAKSLFGGAVRLGKHYFPGAFPKGVPVPDIGQSAQGILSKPANPVRALLPEMAASQQKPGYRLLDVSEPVGPPRSRFYAGPEGVADSSVRNTFDPGPSNRIRPELADPSDIDKGYIAPTILPGEVAPGLVDVPAPIAASHSLGRRAAEPLTDIERAHRRWLPEHYKKDAPVHNVVRDPRNIPDPNAGYYPGPGSRGDVGNLPPVSGVKTGRPRKAVTPSNQGDVAAQEVLDKAKTSDVPEIVAAAGQAAESRPWKLKYDDLFTSISTQIAKTGQAGKEIARRLGRARTISEQRAGTWIQRFEDATKDLSEKEFDDLVEVLDTGEKAFSKESEAYTIRSWAKDQRQAGFPKDEVREAVVQARRRGIDPTRSDDLYDLGDYMGSVEDVVGETGTGTVLSPKVAEAYDAVRAIDAEVTDLAKKSGMGYKTQEGKLVPWKARENYWPHKFDPKELEEGKTIIDRIMKSEGITRAEAEKVIKNSNRFGEKLISEQHKRQLNVEGWRRDPNAMKQHLYDMADRISHAEELGPMDIVKGPLADLIEQTSDPNLVKRNLERVLNREMPVYGENLKGKFDQQLTKAAAAAHLSQFAIGNFNQNAATLMRSNMSDFVKAIGSRIKNKGEFYRSAQRSGVLETTMQDIYREAGGSGSKISKLYGIRASEQFNRALASQTGRNKADRLWSRLSDPKNADAIKLARGIQTTSGKTTAKLKWVEKSKSQLEELLQREISYDDILTSGGQKLPESELAQAGGKMAEVTQGRAQTMDLPYSWKGNDPLTLYRKYAFRQGRILVDAFKENPKKFMLMAGPLSAIMGEASGDIKAGIAGGVKGTLTGEGPVEGAGKEIASRGEYMGKTLEKFNVSDDINNPYVRRALENLMQAWFFGLPGTVVEALTQGKPQALAVAAGPIIDEAVGLAVDSVSLAKGDVKPLGRNLTRKIPFVGPGVQRAFFPTQRQSTKKSGRLQ